MPPSDKAFHIDVVDVGSLQASGEKSLLTSLEAAGLDIHYHCREGFCGACRTKILEGDVDYTTDPLAFIDDDEILPCCCVPLTPLKIVINR
ncbi:class I ribonucleotide reductase maintenance protein YfaE [Alteromonas sp. CYL-A6]|uniref:class I ribonucleotide reductase maintenance protein YfaE n=1 Tax=Alteromonas nitratireducens TaxID=3390813 RepID=UPI0034B811DB